MLLCPPGHRTPGLTTMTRGQQHRKQQPHTNNNHISSGTTLNHCTVCRPTTKMLRLQCSLAKRHPESLIRIIKTDHSFSVGTPGQKTAAVETATAAATAVGRSVAEHIHTHTRYNRSLLPSRHKQKSARTLVPRPGVDAHALLPGATGLRRHSTLSHAILQAEGLQETAVATTG